MMINPKVSVVIPVYNGRNYLREAIDSVLAQTYKNIEVIVVNDGSNDEGQTRAICLEYGRYIVYLEKGNGGVASALNFGLSRMTGAYFSWLSHDDRYLPRKIEDQIDTIKRLNAPKVILYGGYELIDENGRQFAAVRPMSAAPKEQLEKPLYPLFNGLINGCTLLIHHSHFERAGYFDERLLSFQDYDLWFRMFRDAKVYCMPEINVQTRVHSSQGTKQNWNHQQEVNQGWIKMMSSVTVREMMELEGSPQAFYKKLYEFLSHAQGYERAAAEAKGIWQLYETGRLSY